MNTSIRVVVNPTAVGLGSRFLPGTASWMKNGAPPRSSPATPPRSHNRPAPSAVVYHVTAASLSDTINITERAGRTAALLIVIEDGTGDRSPRVRTMPVRPDRLLHSRPEEITRKLGTAPARW